MYQVILFDLDGTLTDPGIGITNSVAYALEKFGILPQSREELYRFIGPPLKEAFEEFYGFSPEDAERAISYYREYFKEHGIYENRLYAGIPSLLQALKQRGKILGLATSKPEKFAKIILEHFNIDQYFGLIAGASMDGKLSKKADVITLALQRGNINDLSSVVMIGDREHDIFGAKQVGLDCIGVLYGYGSEQELRSAGAIHIAKTVSELSALL